MTFEQETRLAAMTADQRFHFYRQMQHDAARAHGMTLRQYQLR